MKYTFKVEELDCANCAAKLEDKINQQSEIQSATINFMKEKAIVESELSQDELIALLNKVSESIGEEAEFFPWGTEHMHEHHEHEHHHHHDHDHEEGEEHEHHHHHHHHHEDGEEEHKHHHHEHEECECDEDSCACDKEHHHHEDEEHEHEHHHHHHEDEACECEKEHCELEEEEHKGKYTFRVEELDCANCAAKLEDKINQQSEIKSATINFMKEKAIVESDLSEKELIALLNQISEDIGEEAQFFPWKEEHAHEHDHAHEHEHHHHHDHEHEEGEEHEHHHHHHHHHDDDEDEELYDHDETIEVSTEGRYVFQVKELDCANCAAKLERKIQEHEAIRFASVNYMKERAIIESDLSEEELIPILNKISEDIGEEAYFLKEEKTEVVRSGVKKEEEKEDNTELYRIICSAVLFVFGNFVVKNEVLQTVILMIAYLVAGYDVLFAAIKNVGKGQLFDENFLMALATVGAICLKEYPEACGVMIFYQIGEYFQDKAVEESRKSITELMDIRPDIAHVLRNGRYVDVYPSEVRVGETIQIRSGEKVPLDGIVIEGNGELDTKALTGESLLRNVIEGSEVLSGSVSSNSVLTVKVTKEFSQSTASKILELVEDASDYKSQSEKFITRFARVYTPAVVISALVIGLIVPLVLYGKLSYNYIYRALVFLMVSCPCALVVSIPLSYFGGLGAASKNGVIIKGSNYLEELEKIDTVVFDKTGTLTKGKFGVTSLHPVDMREEDLLSYAAKAEYYSAHPIGQSIVEKYAQEIDESELHAFKEIANRGVKILVNTDEVFVGSSKLLRENGIEVEVPDTYEAVVYVAVNQKYAGYLTISDEVKENAKTALTDLKNHGVSNLVMLTGDSRNIAEAIGTKLGLTEVHSELLPAEKVSKVEALMNEGKSVAFVGDGINDAPVLKRSNLGIAMGALGSDAAIEAADIVLMNDDLEGISTAKEISVMTKKIVYQNVIFALGVKFIVLILGALGKATMWAATFADVGVAMLCVLNALRLLRYKKK